MKNLSGSSMKELVRVQNTLQAEIRNSTRNTREEIEALKAKGKQLELVKNEINKVRSEMLGMGSNSSFFGKMADGFNKYFAITTAFVATFSGVIFSFKKAVDAYNEFEKSVDNLSALTGLAGEDLNWLANQARDLSTATIEGGIRITQSSQDIVNAYTKVGSARPELLKNKDALNSVTKDAIILSEAANSELQPAIEGLTMVMNQFNLPASESRRVINALAAGSKEGAGEIPYLTAAVEKSGTVAADAGISIETLIGTIETLAPRISQPEIAGRTLKGVLLDLQTGADDTNPAIVGMGTAFENLAKKNLTITELTKMFGVENVTTAKILINNVGELKKYTDAVTGTSVAIEQATINTDNNASRLAQAKNRFADISITLGEKLAPALTFSTNGVTYFIKAIVVLIDNFRKWAPFLYGATAAIVAYTLVVHGATAAKYLYKKALDVVTWAQNVFNKAVTSNPWGAVAAALAAVITVLLTYKRALSATELAQKALNDVNLAAKKSITEEKLEMELLLAVAQDEKRSKEDRIKAITALNELSPAYLGNLKLETINTNEAKEATDKYIASLEREAKVKAAKDKLAELEGQLLDLGGKDKLVETTWMQDIGTAVTSMGNSQVAMLQTVKKERANYLEEEQKIIAQKNKLLGVLKEQASAEDILGTKIGETTKYSKKDTDYTDSTTKSKEKQKGAYELLNNSISETEKLLHDQLLLDSPLAKQTSAELSRLQLKKDMIDSLYDSLVKASEANSAFFNPDYETKYKPDNTPLVVSPSSKVDEKLSGNAFNLQKDSLQQMLIDRKITTQQFDDEMEAMELAHLQRVLEARTKAGEDTKDIEKKIFEKTVKLLKDKEQTEKEAITKKVEMYKAIGDSLASVSEGIMNGQIKTFADFGKAMLAMMLDILSKIIDLKIAEATAIALATPDSVLSFGATGLARAVIIGGLLKGLLAGAKAILLSDNSTGTEQHFDGRYEVTGAQDGKRYQAEWAGVPVTGLYTSPSLIAETGSEIIIDPYRTRNIMMNYPYLLDAIKSVPQHAFGTVPAGPSQMEIPSALMAVLEQLATQLGMGIRAKMVYSEFEEVNERVTDIRNSVKTR
jgi:TP901 family phage tail tape measure protein